ncbi:MULTISPECIES: non-ribosomal peptide synthetase [Corynebacterium]|uniref:Phenyloxazoline synthase MbtB n=2 Tax=Corynebacterium TaxID=1716 RepID=G0HGD5_CORVD|nr:non-ribosomal peptide synthetase [Corynebacterium variabile]AEK38174.1 nonribosomal peptide synthetase [Corynebacterium variabile DSM 44702]
MTTATTTDPRTLMRQLAADSLGATVAEIEDSENLISLGLDSVAMIGISARVREATGLQVPFAAFARDASVDGWTRIVAEAAAEGPADAAAATDLSPAGSPLEAAPFPLATMQHAYWVGRTEGQVLGGVAAHLYAEFDGPAVDPDRLSAAVDRLTDRHTSLRTRVLPNGTQEVLDAPGKPVFTVTDLRDRNTTEIEQDLESIRETKTHQLLDLAAGQVIDISLTLLPGDRSRLHLDVDMIAADAMSYRTILADLAAFYREQEPSPAILDYQYRTYLHEHGTSMSAAAEKEGAWWRERVTDYPEAPSLPLVPEQKMADPHRSVRLDVLLSPDQKARLYDRAHAHGVTPAMVLATVFSDTLARWSSHQRFLLNLPLFDREPLHEHVAGLVGDFSNSLLLDVDVDAGKSFLERVRSMQSTLHETAEHSAFRGLDVLRELGHNAGAPVTAPVVYTSGLDLGELFAEAVTEEFGEPVWIISQGPQVVLDAQVAEIKGGILLNWDVRRDAFPEGVIEAMFAAYRGLLEELLARDEMASDWTLPHTIALPESQRQVRERIEKEAAEAGAAITPRTLHDSFFDRAATDPDRPAVFWGTGENGRGTGIDAKTGQLTYGELAERALRVAGALQAKGVKAGDTVAVHTAKGHRQIPVVLGILALGANFLPIGADQPEARRTVILERSGAVAIVTDKHGKRLGSLPEGVTKLDLQAALTSLDSLTERATVDPDAVAYVLFTSGSTGEPKGVEVPHRAAANTIDAVAEVFHLDENDRTLNISVLEFDPSVMDFFGALHWGGSIIAVEADEAKEALVWAQLAQRYGATALTVAPSILGMLLDVATVEQLQSLHAVMLGGDWVTVDLPTRLHELAPQARFAGLGGATEVAIHCTVCEVTGPVPEQWSAVPYGTPLPNFRCRVVNAAGQDAPDFVAGELWIGGPSVADGYRNDPERTAEKFVEEDGTRWYRTGDLAFYHPDGMLEFLGRADHQVQVKGYRIELGEVETALRTVPGASEAVAFVTDDSPKRLFAAVTPVESTDAEALAETDLREAVGALVPAYMVPERVEVFETFPLTRNGKTDRKAIAAEVAARGAAAAAEGNAPATPLEVALTVIVNEVLPEELVAVDRDFFSAGGDSVLATRATAHIREHLAVQTLVSADFFQARTIRDLAKLLRKQEDTADGMDEAVAAYLAENQVEVTE